MIRSRMGVLAVVTAGAVSLAACSSSGGGGPSQSDIEGKLKKDPQLTALESQLHLDKTKVDTVDSCVAKAMEKYVSKSDIQDYVNGKKQLGDLGAKSKGGGQKADQYTKSCVQNSLGTTS